MKGKLIIIISLLCLVLLGSISCNPFGESDTAVTEELTEVVRGDLTVTVSGSGTMEFPNKIKLAFGVAGRIDKILVQEGNEVNKGDVLAKLKTDDLELAITQAGVAVTQAEVAVTQAEVTVTQAELSVQTAEYELKKAQDLYAKPEIYQARQAVTEAESYLEYAKWQLAQSSTTKDKIVWTNEVKVAEENLRAAKVRLNEMLAAPDTEEVALKRLQVTSANQSLGLARQSLELNQKSLALARQSLVQARKQLEEATITAPFDGIVADTYAKEGDFIPPPSIGPMPIIYLIDTTTMELEVQVDEIDVVEVKPGQTAIIEVDALPTLPFEGKVKSIDLLPKVESGVTVYDVTIDFQVADDIGLRAGMSATADIVIAERSNALLVPDRAITQNSEGNHVVDIMIDGRVEERTVVIGISDSFQTEILEGLEVGEVVIERRARPQSSAPGFF